MNINPLDNKTKEQDIVLSKWVDAGCKGTYLGVTAIGKCLGKGTKLFLSNGSLIKVEDLSVGDLVMGEDSKSKKVVGLHKGRGQLFKVQPFKGDSFICNKNHILSLKHTISNKVINISISDYNKKSKGFKHLYKLYRVPLKFKTTKEPLIDPYVLGLFLGDGSIRTNSLILHVGGRNIKTIIRSLSNILRRNKCKISVIKHKKPNNFYRIGIRNPGNRKRYKGMFTSNPSNIMKLFTSYYPNGISCADKYIPHEYLVSTENNRKYLLAGLLDTDGSVSNKCFDYTSKSRKLAEGVKFLSLSLGLYASIKKSIKSSQTGKKGLYWRVIISGNTDRVPTLIKIASPRNKKKDVLKTGFSIENIGIGDYYGFELEGNGLFCLESFIVTHNCRLGVMAAGNDIKASDNYCLNRRWLITTPTENLRDNQLENKF